MIDKIGWLRAVDGVVRRLCETVGILEDVDVVGETNESETTSMAVLSAPSAYLRSSS